MGTMKRIRQDVFASNQTEFAAIAGVNQATVSRWDHGLLVPSLREMQRIRNEAKARGLLWNDAWFFEVAA